MRKIPMHLSISEHHRPNPDRFFWRPVRGMSAQAIPAAVGCCPGIMIAPAAHRVGLSVGRRDLNGRL